MVDLRPDQPTFRPDPQFRMGKQGHGCVQFETAGSWFPLGMKDVFMVHCRNQSSYQPTFKSASESLTP